MVRKGIKISIAILVTCLFVISTGCKLEGLTGQIGAVQGVVQDQSGNPLVSSLVTVEGSSYSALTNVDGRYVLNLPVGSYVLAATRDGFTSQSKQVNVDENSDTPVSANFVMNGGTNNGPSLYVSLEANDELYHKGKAIKVKLNVVNRGDQTIKIGGEQVPWEIIAHSEEGWRIWHTAGTDSEAFELLPGESKSFEAKWEWYEHPINRPVVVMLEGHVNPQMHTILPVEGTINGDGTTNDNGTSQSGGANGEETGDNAGTTSASIEVSTPYIAGYVTEPLFIRLRPEGYAEPINDPDYPHIEPYPMPHPYDPYDPYEPYDPTDPGRPEPWISPAGNNGTGNNGVVCGIPGIPGIPGNLGNLGNLGQCYVPGSDGIEPWVYFGEEAEEIVIRPRCWRFSRYRRFFAK